MTSVAVVTPAPWYQGDPARFSIDLECYVDALHSIGSTCRVVCPPGSDPGRCDVALIASVRDMSEPAWWRRQQFDVAIVLTWLRHASLVEAIAAAGTTVIARADTDGLVSARQHPWRIVRQGWLEAGTARMRAKVMLHAGHRIVRLSLKEDTELVRSIAASDVVLVETSTAVTTVTAVLARLGASDLSSRLELQPHFLPRTTLDSPVVMRREPRVVAAGRWSAPQKHVELLAEAVRHVPASAGMTLEIFGAPVPVLEALAASDARVLLAGVQPRSVVVDALRQAQVLVSASRWEGAPLVAAEALASGTSIAGPPIPAFRGLREMGAPITVSTAHRARPLAAALATELAAWDTGARDPRAAAAHWRQVHDASRQLPRLLTVRKGTPT